MHTVLLSIQKLDDGEYKILWLVEGVKNFVLGYGYFAAPETRPFTSRKRNRPLLGSRLSIS
jgi:hypothetical protein